MIKFQSGDRVKFKDGDNRIFQVYAVYNKDYVSLGLHDHPDTEQDYLTSVSEITKL